MTLDKYRSTFEQLKAGTDLALKEQDHELAEIRISQANTLASDVRGALWQPAWKEEAARLASGVAAWCEQRWNRLDGGAL